MMKQAILLLLSSLLLFSCACAGGNASDPESSLPGSDSLPQSDSDSSANATSDTDATSDTNAPSSGTTNVIKLHPQASFRVMTYNLACLVSDAPECAEAALRVIQTYMPDIMGLQECKKNVYNAILQYLPETYANAVPFHENGTTVNYTPIFYNTEKFSLVDGGLVWLRGRYTKTNTKSLTWAVLEDLDGNRFALINFHGAVCSAKYEGFENFTDAQRNQQATEWKLDNVAQALEIKDTIEAAYGKIPIMISGDHNFNSDSQPYKNLTAAGFADAERTARISRKTGYKTSYSYGNIPGTGLSIDHIFGLNGVDFVLHEIARNSDVWLASDHCPVYVDFNLSRPS